MKFSTLMFNPLLTTHSTLIARKHFPNNTIKE